MPEEASCSVPTAVTRGDLPHGKEAEFLDDRFDSRRRLTAQVKATCHQVHYLFPGDLSCFPNDLHDAGVGAPGNDHETFSGLQDQGQLGNYTLDDIREIFERVPESLIADIVSGKEPLEVAPYGRTLRGRPDALGSPRERIERLRRFSERQRSPGETERAVELRRRSSWP